MHYLITGHTGFKGSWLSLMLYKQGHTVSGISLEPREKSLFNQAELKDIFKFDLRIDIRDLRALKTAVEKIDPEVIIHLAAQPLVRESYKIPIETFEVNVLGTLHLLESSRELKSLRDIQIITTDKVYKNYGHLRGYVETDELGGDDPYSSSKAAADIAAQSWIKNFAKVPITVVRAGNVIGGGDWAKDRLIPDLVESYSKERIPSIRYPEAIRPWQHVLDCLNGYLLLMNKQLSESLTGVWNFGPQLTENHSVAALVNEFAREMNVEMPAWKVDSGVHLEEAGYLLLNSEKARKELGWKDQLGFQETISWTASWYREYNSCNIREFTLNQIENFYIDL